MKNNINLTYETKILNTGIKNYNKNLAKCLNEGWEIDIDATLLRYYKQTLLKRKLIK